MGWSSSARELERRLEQQQHRNSNNRTKNDSTHQHHHLYRMLVDISRHPRRSQKRLKRISEDRDDLKKYRRTRAVGLYVVFQRSSHWTQKKKKQQVQHTEQSTHDCSQIGDVRPLTSCCFSKDKRVNIWLHLPGRVLRNSGTEVC